MDSIPEFPRESIVFIRPDTVDAKTWYRFWTKTVDGAGGCILWSAGCDWKNYPKFSFCGRTVKAHRVVYEWLVGKIPEEYEVDHLCNRHNCVNPQHLEAVTKAENLSRVKLRNTHCKRGHQRTDINTYISPSGARVCRDCLALNKHKYIRIPTPERKEYERKWREGHKEERKLYNSEWHRNNKLQPTT
jgi:hypothetical protein